MKIGKIALIVVVGYVGLVVLFESLIGFFQPTSEGTLIITTTDEEGNRDDRVVSRLSSGGELYVAANHWPRAWFEQAIENPEVQIVIDGKKSQYTAVPVSGSEHDRVERDNALPIAFRILTGFPPRYFLRLDPTS